MLLRQLHARVELRPGHRSSFPRTGRGLRETELQRSQNEHGHQVFRLPTFGCTIDHDSVAACDGQLGGIVKCYREWRTGGNVDWLRGLWPLIRRSLDFCIEQWDPSRNGVLVEPQHNTYDIEFWGPNGMCMSFYLAALHAAIVMGEALDDDTTEYRCLRDA